MTSPRDVGLPPLLAVEMSDDESVNESDTPVGLMTAGLMRGPVAPPQAEVPDLAIACCETEGAREGKASWESVST